MRIIEEIAKMDREKNEDRTSKSNIDGRRNKDKLEIQKK